MSNGWTPERRMRQAALIANWKPWSHSTGPSADPRYVQMNAATGMDCGVGSDHVDRVTKGLDTEIKLLGRRSAATTIRGEYERGKAALRRDSSGWMADIERDDGKTESFPIS